MPALRFTGVKQYGLLVMRYIYQRNSLPMNNIYQNNFPATSFRHQLWCSLAGLVLLLFSYKVCSSQTPSANIFNQLVQVPAEKRPDQALTLFKQNFRKVSSATAMQALDTLEGIAQRLNDKPLEGIVFLCRADYYSVNKGFNKLSTQYHQQAVDFAVEHNLLLQQASYRHAMGYYFFVYNQNTQACRNFLESYEKFKAYGFVKVPFISKYLSEQASFFYNLKDWDSAQSLLQQALKYKPAPPRLHASITTTIGLIYRGKKQYNTALQYFNQALQIAINGRDSEWIGISNGNIGSVYFLQGNYTKAMPLITADYRTSIKYRDSVNAAIALLRIARMNLKGGKLALAQQQLDTVASFTAHSNNKANLSSLAELYQLRSLLYQQNGRWQQAIQLREKYEAAQDSLARRNNIAAVENVKLKWTIESHHNQIAQLKTNMQNGKFKRNAVIFILFLLGVIFLLLFNRYRLNAKKNQQLLLAEKRRVDEELENAAQALRLYTENLRNNNLLIEKFKTELAQAKAHNQEPNSEHLEQLLNARLMTAEAWDEFKRLFERVHSGFFLGLRKQHPNLTDTDMRLLSLVKLGLNNREMSNMVSVTVEGIKKSKQRLRKKMNLEPEQDIEHIVANF